MTAIGEKAKIKINNLCTIWCFSYTATVHLSLSKLSVCVVSQGAANLLNDSTYREDSAVWKVNSTLSLSASRRKFTLPYIYLALSTSPTPPSQLYYFFPLFISSFLSLAPFQSPLPILFVFYLSLYSLLSLPSTCLPALLSCLSPFTYLFSITSSTPSPPSSFPFHPLGFSGVWSIRSSRHLSIPCRQPSETLTIWEELWLRSSGLFLFYIPFSRVVFSSQNASRIAISLWFLSDFFLTKSFTLSRLACGVVWEWCWGRAGIGQEVFQGIIRE